VINNNIEIDFRDGHNEKKKFCLEVEEMRMCTCDYEDCDEFAQWYRRLKGKLLTLCTKHEVEFARKHWGRSIDASELNSNDIRYLEGKEEKKEYRKTHPFKVRFFLEENETWKIRIRDSETDERP
jgi:hypothetical protein